jgi:pilus assembly protein Flp/PilA
LWLNQLFNSNIVLEWKSFKLTRSKSGGPNLDPVGGAEKRVCRRMGFRSRSKKVFKSMKNFAADESGVTAIEYALIASLIAVFIITAVQTVGTKVSTVFNEVGATLK